MRVLFLVNRASGGYEEALVDRCVDAVRGAGAEVKVRRPGGPGEFRALLEEAVGSYDAVVLGGGDGTVGLAADVLRGADQPVAVLPLGRGNTFYKSVYGDGDPCRTLRGAVAEGSVWRVDLGYAVELDRFFVLGASLGFMAEVLRSSSKYLFLGGRPAYALAALERVFRGVQPAECAVEAGGREVYSGGAMLLSAGMTMYRAGRFRLFPEARLDDGLADYLVIPRLSRLRALRLLGAALRGAHVGFGGVVYGQASRVRFSCSRVLGEVDGDIVGFLEELTVEVRPGMLSILVPRGEAS